MCEPEALHTTLPSTAGVASNTHSTKGLGLGGWVLLVKQNCSLSFMVTRSPCVGSNGRLTVRCPLTTAVGGESDQSLHVFTNGGGSHWVDHGK